MCLEDSTYTDAGTTGLGGFLFQLTEAHPELEPHIGIIKKFILDSGCRKIEIREIKLNALGASLSSGVIIDPSVLRSLKERTLYTVFHEIVHQYQYRKYGEDVVENLFLANDNEDDAVTFLRKTELVADRYAIKKCRELAKLGVLDPRFIPKYGNYKHYSRGQFRTYLNTFRDICRKNNITDHKKVAEMFYNFITTGGK